MLKSGWMVAAGVALAVTMAGGAAEAKGKGHPQAEAQGLDILKRAIAFRTVQGPGNQTPQFAAYLKSQLVAGGFADADVTVTPVDDTAYLVARYRGSDSKAKPLLISGHMDVVEAKPADWQRDPFTPVIENGYIFGRGATDMKFDAAMVTATLIEMKRQHVVPRRDIIMVLSGDEETAMKTTALLAAQFPNGEMALNADGGGGHLSEEGKPQFFTVQGAEKTYADFQLTVTNPGGHSSAPRKDNAIVQLSRALARIGAYQFTPQVNELTRASFVAAAEQKTGPLSDAMRAFAKDPTDQQAIAVLTADPAYVGQIGTTCVATMVSGGHALNALPQRATANINCRIFPGVKPADVQAKLAEVAADPAVTITDVTEGAVPSDASPLRPDVMSAVTKALAIDYPGVPIIPAMSAGASDSMHFRARGVPSYGVSPVFIKESEDFSHGLNERTPLANVAPSISYWLSLFTDLSK
jgi:acetylornithine deacetylase/succinyl-diaminopimelate desuccinylase-like protein